MSQAARHLLAILAASLALRLALWTWIALTDEHRFLDSDTWSYHLLARALLELHEFAVSPQHPAIPETNRTPGYPAFLADVYAVFGERPAIVALVQIGLGLATTALAFEWRHHFLPNAYPVYALDFSSRVRTVLEGLAAIANLDTRGRGGRFFYSHLHDQLRSAKDYIRDRFATDGHDRTERLARLEA
jgi:hypothetical protein